MIISTNNLAKLGIAAAHAMRLELADQLYYPVAVDIRNPSQPLTGGYVGNRGGQSVRLSGNNAVPAFPATDNDGDGADGNTGGYGADFSALSGDPMAVVKTNTLDGPIFTLQRYDSSGIVTVEDPTLGLPPGGVPDFRTIARYIIKADGLVYDLLDLTGTDTAVTTPGAAGFNGPYSHWELATDVANGTGTYTPGTNSYTPSIAPGAINASHYIRPVGVISFRPKDGASSGAIQEQLTRAQSTLDLMSRMLRSLHDEAKGPFANIVVR